MIVSKLNEQQPRFTKLQQALDDFRSMNEPALLPGRYEMPNGSYLLITEFETVPEEMSRFEAHGKYTDVQILLKGSECIGYYKGNDALCVEDNPDQDIAFYSDVPNYDRICLFENMFAIFFPGELHKPNCYVKNTGHIRKAVIKIPDFDPMA